MSVNITNEQILALKRISPIVIPLNPTAAGWSAAQVRDYFSKYIFEENDGLIAIINGILSSFKEGATASSLAIIDNSDNTFSFELKNSEGETIISSQLDLSNFQTDSANIYYTDNLPEDESKLKNGDLWFVETE